MPSISPTIREPSTVTYGGRVTGRGPPRPADSPEGPIIHYFGGHGRCRHRIPDLPAQVTQHHMLLTPRTPPCEPEPRPRCTLAPWGAAQALCARGPGRSPEASGGTQTVEGGGRGESKGGKVRNEHESLLLCQGFSVGLGDPTEGLPRAPRALLRLSWAPN